jgi:hypothetical protein
MIEAFKKKFIIKKNKNNKDKTIKEDESLTLPQK